MTYTGWLVDGKREGYGEVFRLGKCVARGEWKGICTTWLWRRYFEDFEDEDMDAHTGDAIRYVGAYVDGMMHCDNGSLFRRDSSIQYFGGFKHGVYSRDMDMWC